MQIHVTSTGAYVRDAYDFSELSVTSKLNRGAAACVLSDVGLATRQGSSAADDHAWLDISELGRLAAPTGDAQWWQMFAAMITHAEKRGWVDKVRNLVRAHVELSS